MEDISAAIASFVPQISRALDLYERRLNFEEKREIRYAANAEQKDEFSRLKLEIKELKAQMPKEKK